MGVSDPALYAHFKGKQEIYEALVKLAGPDLLAKAGPSLLSFKNIPMQTALPEMFGNIVQTWSTPRARAFAALVLRMGSDGLGPVLQDVVVRLRPVFSAWQEVGELRKDIPVDVAIWQVIGPLAGLRITYLHCKANAGEINNDKKLARTHLQTVAQSLSQPRDQAE